MAALDEKNVEKKMRSASNTQESIQSLSLWVIHHKAHHEKIVEIWFRVLKKSGMPHRLILFNLCNDIVQTCKRKHAVVYKDAFKELLKDAVILVRDNAVRKNIERIFTIWEERGIYNAEFIEELGGILNNTTKVNATKNSRLIAAFQPQTLYESIASFQRLEKEVELKRLKLSNLSLDASSIEAVRQLKDRAHGREFSHQFDESCNKLDDFVSKLEVEVKERAALIELMEQSELFYDGQYGEAKIVANAYKNFGTRVNNLRKKLEQHKASLPEPLSPVPSPPEIDAPSPGQTPPEEEVEDMQAIDMEISDDEKDQATRRVVRQDSTTVTKSYPLPIPSITEIRMKKSGKKYVLDDNKSPRSVESAPSPEGSPVDLQLSPSPLEMHHEVEERKSDEDLEDFLPKIAQGAKASFMTEVLQNTELSRPKEARRERRSQIRSQNDPRHKSAAKRSSSSSSWNTSHEETDIGMTSMAPDTESDEPQTSPTVVNNNIVTLTSGEGTPVNDEGGATPVQDEKPEPNETGNVASPIDFLTQLINQTQKTTQSNTNILQSLSALTKTVKPQFENSKTLDGQTEDQPQPEVEEVPDETSTWAQWKAQQPPLPPQPVAPPQPQPAVPSPSPVQPVPPPIPAPYQQQPLTTPPGLGSPPTYPPQLPYQQPGSLPPPIMPMTASSQPPLPETIPRPPLHVQMPPDPIPTDFTSPPLNPPPDTGQALWGQQTPETDQQLWGQPQPDSTQPPNWGQPDTPQSDGSQQPWSTQQQDDSGQSNWPAQSEIMTPSWGQQPDNGQSTWGQQPQLDSSPSSWGRQQSDSGHSSWGQHLYPSDHHFPPPPPPPPVAVSQPSPPAQPPALLSPRAHRSEINTGPPPPKSILRKQLSNLTTLTTCDADGEPDDVNETNSNSGATIPTISSSFSRPPRPPFPPKPPTTPPSPRTSSSTGSMASIGPAVQQEFIEKLKRKSSVSTPASLAPPKSILKNSNLRTLTEVQTTDAQEEGEIADTDEDVSESVSVSAQPANTDESTKQESTSDSQKVTKPASAEQESKPQDSKPITRVECRPSGGGNDSRVIPPNQEKRNMDVRHGDARHQYYNNFRREPNPHNRRDRFGGYYRDPYRDPYGQPYPKRHQQPAYGNPRFYHY